MILRFKIWKYRITLTCAPVVAVVGANSNIGKDQHILMWDFDGVPLRKVKKALASTQFCYHLPEIKVFKTSQGKNYQAWCYKKVSWRIAKAIVAVTVHVDEGFFRFGVFREHFTLRTSQKLGHTPKLVATLPSDVKPDCNEFDLMSWTKYETLQR